MNMNAAVIVAIQHLKGLGIELKTGNRRAKNCPQLLVQFT